MISGCRPLRGLFLCTPTILGFRSAPPQALRYRHASRAQCKLFTNAAQNGSLKIPFEQGVVLLNVGGERAVFVEPRDMHQPSVQRDRKCALQL